MSTYKYPVWAQDKPEIPESAIADSVTADVVVIGCGNAGLLATAAAAYAGASVSVIEQQREKSFGTYGIPDIGTINSKWAAENGYKPVDVSDFVAEWQHRTVNRSDPRIIHQYAAHSGEMLDWLFTLMDPEDRAAARGYDFSNTDEMYSDVGGYRSWLGTCALPTWHRGGVRRVIANCQAHGAVWYWGNTACVLTQNEAGRVTGVITKDRDGVYHKYLARKGVILTAGDWGANHEMYVNLYQEIVQQYESYGLDTDKLRTALGRDGMGVKLAVWAGGSMEPGPYASVYPTAFPPEVADDKLMGLGGGMRGTSFLKVTSEGKRYCDEGIMGMYGSTHRTLRMGPGMYYNVYDSQWPEYLSRQCNEHFMMGKGQAEINGIRRDYARLYEMGGVARMDFKPDHTDINIPAEGEMPTHVAADTLEELADRMVLMGLDPAAKETFIAQVKHYNEMCYQGKDTDFGKDPRLMMPIDKPPYYAACTQIVRPDVGVVTLNGVITDENQAVLGKDYKPIPGLFASGTNGGGKFFMQYASLLSGMCVGSAMTLGMLAGRHVAALESTEP